MILVFVLMLLAVISFPYENLLEFADIASAPVRCWHWWTMMKVFTFCLCYISGVVMGQFLSNPFQMPSIDSINVDAVMAASEQTIFASLRSNFDAALRDVRAKEPGFSESI